MRSRLDTPLTKRLHWLCIAYAFPPINRSGTHRTLGFVNHLDRLGWDATVLTVEPGSEPVDEALSSRVPAGTTVIRTPWVDLIDVAKSMTRLGRRSRATVTQGHPKSTPCHTSTLRAAPVSACRAADFSPRGFTCARAYPAKETPEHNSEFCSNGRSPRDYVSRLLMTPDSRVGWIPQAVRAGLRAVRRRRPDVIYSTSPYMSAHLIALMLARRTRIPWVADFRDPWRGNPFRNLGYSSLEWLDARMEAAVLRRAAHIVCNTPTMMEHLRRRMPAPAGKCSTILNAYDAELLEGIQPKRPTSADAIVLTHCGQFYGRRSPNVWFKALRRLTERPGGLAKPVLFVQIGPDTYDGKSLAKLAADEGVVDRVRILGPTSHAEALSYMAGSDALALAGSSGPASELQVPNKLFEYLAVRRPIIATLTRQSPGVSILKDARAPHSVCEPDDDRAVAAAIEQIAEVRGTVRADAGSGVERFERSHRAAQLAAVFGRLISRRLATHTSNYPAEQLAPSFGRRTVRVGSPSAL